MKKRWIVSYLDGYSMVKSEYVFASSANEAVVEIKNDTPNFREALGVIEYLTEYERNSK